MSRAVFDGAIPLTGVVVGPDGGGLTALKGTVAPVIGWPGAESETDGLSAPPYPATTVTVVMWPTAYGPIAVQPAVKSASWLGAPLMPEMQTTPPAAGLIARPWVQPDA